MVNALSYITQHVRKYDYDRFLCSIFVPEEERKGLLAILAFNVEISKIREIVREGVIGEIRLQWWRDTIEFIYNNSKYIYTDRIIAYELSLAIKKFNLSRKLFDQLIDARSRDFLDLPFADEAELYQYLYGTSSTICMLFLEVMCPKNCPLSHDKMRAAQSIGVAWALTGIMRSSNVLAEQRRIYIPKSVMKKYCFNEEDFFAQRATNEIKCLTEHIVSIARNEIRKSRNLLETKWDDQYLALSLQAGLSEMYLNKVESLSFDPFSKKIETGQFWRQLKVAVMAARAWF